jgi:hypothetical protein
MTSDDRDEFIYTRVFNNNKISTKIPIDFTIGTIEEWGMTCKKFNSGEAILNFALIYIVYNNLVCSNIHPFVEIECITKLLSTHVIHD